MSILSSVSGSACTVDLCPVESDTETLVGLNWQDWHGNFFRHEADTFIWMESSMYCMWKVTYQRLRICTHQDHYFGFYSSCVKKRKFPLPSDAVSLISNLGNHRINKTAAPNFLRVIHIFIRFLFPPSKLASWLTCTMNKCFDSTTDITSASWTAPNSETLIQRSAFSIYWIIFAITTAKNSHFLLWIP